MGIAHRFYYGVVGSLPYVVLLVGIVSVLLGAWAFVVFPTNTPGSAWWSLALGAFLVWAGTSAVRNARARGDGEDVGSDEP